MTSKVIRVDQEIKDRIDKIRKEAMEKEHKYLSDRKCLRRLLK